MDPKLVDIFRRLGQVQAPMAPDTPDQEKAPAKREPKKAEKPEQK